MTGVQRRVVLEDVARRANVSESTASRALANDPRIKTTTAAAVRKAAEELGFVPNAVARGLRVKRSRILGLLLADLSDPVHGQVASGFEQEAGEAGYRVIFAAGLQDPTRERRALTVFTEQAAEGVALVSSVLAPSEMKLRVPQDRLIIAKPEHRSTLGDGASLLPGVIRTDDASGITAAVDHLVLSGYRDIGYVEVATRASTILRREAVERALRAHGLRVPLRRFIAPENAWRSPGALAERIAGALPDALICYDDLIALALMHALRGMGIVAPDHIGIVGFDGIPFAAMSNPRLTTIATPSVELGRLAAWSLISAIRTGKAPPATLLPVELVIGESTRSATRPDRADEPPV